MKDFTVKAYAKLNLSMDVLRKMEDGYHEVCTVMQSVSLHDSITVRFQGQGITVKSNFSYLPSDEKNIAVKAAKLFYSAAGLPEPGLVVPSSVRQTPISTSDSISAAMA